MKVVQSPMRPDQPMGCGWRGWGVRERGGEQLSSQIGSSAVAAGADGVLLDELSAQQLSSLVPMLRALALDRVGGSSVVLEASGVNPADLKAYSQTGVDLISTSAPVTRSSWLDLSMRFTPLEN